MLWVLRLTYRRYLRIAAAVGVTTTCKYVGQGRRQILCGRDRAPRCRLVARVVSPSLMTSLGARSRAAKARHHCVPPRPATRRSSRPRACLGPRRHSVLLAPHVRRLARDGGARGFGGRAPKRKQWLATRQRRSWHASAMLHQRCRDTQPIAALTAACTGRSLGHTAKLPLGEMATELSVASLRAQLSAGARGGFKARSAYRQWTPPAHHHTCTRHEPAPFPCGRSACLRLSPAR